MAAPLLAATTLRECAPERLLCQGRRFEQAQRAAALARHTELERAELRAHSVDHLLAGAQIIVVEPEAALGEDIFGLRVQLGGASGVGTLGEPGGDDERLGNGRGAPQREREVEAR